MDVSIIIVNYMTYSITLNSINSIFRWVKKLKYEVILIDNASPNGDGEKLEAYFEVESRVKFIQSDRNRGFSVGNNLGLEYASGRYVLFLNSDTELKNDCISEACLFLDQNDNVGAVSAKLVTKDGKLDSGCKRGFPTPENSLYFFLKMNKLFQNKKYDGYKLSFLDEDMQHEVDVISGAFLFTRLDLLNDIGSFDEAFFMYGEDVDLCYRIKNSAMKVVYNPKLGTVLHYKGASGKRRVWKTLFYFYNSMIIFYKKNYQKKYNFMINILVYLGIIMAFIFNASRNLFRKA